MKSILITIAAMTVMAISSCYVGIEGRHHHHAASIQIQASDNVNQKDSLHTSAMTEKSKTDSVQSPVNPGAAK